MTQSMFRLLVAPWGRGPCVAISGEQPCPALLRDLPMQWTVWISPRGERLTGRGNLFPLPCLPHSNHLTSRRHPARAFAGIPMHFSGSPHPTRAFGAPPPPPPRGRGPCVAIPGGKSVSGVEPAGNRIRLFPTYPLCTGPWCIRHWGRRPAGRGNASPLPCPLRPPDLTHLGNPTRAPCRHPPPRTR